MGQTSTWKLWGIILAGGEGTRVRPLLSQICGGRGIKQFCAIIGRRSMLEHTLARVERLIPRQRLLVVVSQDHRAEAEAQLGHWPRENVIYQPANRDTAAGILLPLAHIAHREPFATVAVFPADHFLLAEDQFLAAVRSAVTETQRFRRELILLGMTPDRLEEGYGWIELGARTADRETYTVQRFWEKPTPGHAQSLLAQGALWNSFVFVVQAATLWEMTRRANADLYTDFMAIRRALTRPHAQELIDSIYRPMRPVNFSVDICEQLPARLRVLPVPEIGWSDWGSGERILASLQQIGRLEEIRARLRHRGSEVQLPPAVSRHLTEAQPPRVLTSLPPTKENAIHEEENCQASQQPRHIAPTSSAGRCRCPKHAEN